MNLTERIKSSLTKTDFGNPSVRKVYSAALKCNNSLHVFLDEMPQLQKKKSCFILLFF